MRQHEFHSSLSPDQVFARLSVRATENRYLDPWVGGKMFLYYRKEERFWLSYTGNIPVARGESPFRGNVTAEGSGSLITGTFAPNPRGTLVLSALCFISMLLFRSPLWFAVFGAALGFAWLHLMAKLIQLPFLGRHKAILKFIEDNLLN